MFEDSMDSDIRDVMRLGEADSVDLWPRIERVLPERRTWVETVIPLLAAAAVLAFAWMATGKSAMQGWPVNDTVRLEPLASIEPR